jgi:hypothetical protein
MHGGSKPEVWVRDVVNRWVWAGWSVSQLMKESGANALRVFSGRLLHAIE